MPRKKKTGPRFAPFYPSVLERWRKVGEEGDKNNPFHRVAMVIAMAIKEVCDREKITPDEFWARVSKEMKSAKPAVKFRKVTEQIKKEALDPGNCSCKHMGNLKPPILW